MCISARDDSLSWPMHALLYVCSRLKELALLSHSQLIAGIDDIDTPPNCLDRDCVGRRRTGTRHGNVYRSIREKQGIVVYRQHVLQTVTSLRVVSLVFRGHDLLKITNINPQQEARFLLWKKKWLFERAAEMEPRSRSTPKRRLA